MGTNLERGQIIVHLWDLCTKNKYSFNVSQTNTTPGHKSYQIKINLFVGDPPNDERDHCI